MVARLTEREGAWKRAKMRNRERAKARTRQCFDLADFLQTNRNEWMKALRRQTEDREKNRTDVGKEPDEGKAHSCLPTEGSSALLMLQVQTPSFPSRSLFLSLWRLSGMNALSKCQNKLLLFPDHAVGKPPTSSPWQPLVSHPKEKGEEEEKKRAFMPLTPLPSVRTHLDMPINPPRETLLRPETCGWAPRLSERTG